MLTTARDTFARVYSACAMRRLDPDKPGTRQWQAQTAAETKVGTSSPRQHQVASHAAHLSGPSEYLVNICRQLIHSRAHTIAAHPLSLRVTFCGQECRRGCTAALHMCSID